jgi:tetratricopeptide (TPR) repeat protein
MTCNTPLMNSWHSFSPNGRWMVFSSKGRSPFTQMYLTHLDENGNDSPAIFIDHATAANRAVNLPEFIAIDPDRLVRIDAPATDFFRVFDLALDLTRSNQPEAAIREWTKAVELNPEEARAQFNLALVLDRQGRFEEAIASYGKAVKLDPQNTGAHTNLAVALARIGKLEEALEEFRKCVEIDPTSAKARHNLGLALIQTGRIQEGIEHCQASVDINPDYVEARNTLGMALAVSGRLDEAVIHLERAVSLNPGVFEHQLNLGRLLSEQRRYETAIRHLMQAVKLTGGEEPVSLESLAAAYAGVGRFRDAAETARIALDLAVRQNNEELAAELKQRISAYEGKTVD